MDKGVNLLHKAPPTTYLLRVRLTRRTVLIAALLFVVTRVVGWAARQRQLVDRRTDARDARNSFHVEFR